MEIGDIVQNGDHQGTVISIEGDWLLVEVYGFEDDGPIKWHRDWCEEDNQ